MKKQLLIIFLLGLIACVPGSIFAQLCNTSGGGFSVTPSAGGCAPLKVEVANTQPGVCCTKYSFTYDIKSPDYSAGNATTYNYAFAGTYTILQVGVSGGNDVYHCEKVVVYESRGITSEYTSCGGGKIKLTLIDDMILKAYDRVEINWGDNTGTQVWVKGNALTLDHEYADVSVSPTIRLKGIYAPGTSCAGGVEKRMPVAFIKPELNNIKINELEMNGNGNLKVTYNGVTSVATEFLVSTDKVNYEVKGVKKSGGLSLVNTLAGLNASQVYYVKLSSKDECGGQKGTDVVSSMTLQGSSADEKNSISWSKYAVPDDFQEYRLMRDGTLLKSFTDINTTSFEDEGVQCGDYYEYSIIAVTKTINSISAPITVLTTSLSPKAVEEAFVTVKSDDAIELTAMIPGSDSKTNYNVVLERAVDGKSMYKKIATLNNETVYEDFNVDAANHFYCYRMIYQNGCGYKSPPSEAVCSVLLKNEAPLMVWTIERPFLEEISSYTITQKGSGGSDTEKNLQLLTTYFPNLNGESDPEYNFQIRADSKSGKFQSFSNVIKYKRDADIFAPDAFSPNDDGYNDTFEVKVAMYKSFKMSVLNRWGEVIFYADDITKGWDGMIKGKPAPVGSYIWHIEIVDNLDQTVKKNGTFVLLK